MALARHFRDLSVPSLPIDASHIVWIATANYVERIPPAIRQRFVVFDIPTPTQSQAIVRSVLRRLKDLSPRLRPFTLDESAEQHLLGLAPREMRKQIRLACGQAALGRRTVLRAVDFPVPVRHSHRIGF